MHIIVFFVILMSSQIKEQGFEWWNKVHIRQIGPLRSIPSSATTTYISRATALHINPSKQVFLTFLPVLSLPPSSVTSLPPASLPIPPANRSNAVLGFPVNLQILDPN